MSGTKKVTVLKPEKKNEFIKVAAYVRVSSDSDDQLHSFKSQMEFYYKKITAMDNAVLADIYADEGVTGTRIDKRDGFKRMIDDCYRSRIDRIITKSIFRFGRNIIETLRVLRELKALGVSIYFELENIDTGKSGSEMMISIYSMMAEQESKTIALNQRWGFRSRAQEGKYNQPHLPYGYTRDHNKRIIVDLEKGTIVQRIYEMYVYEDMSTEKIKTYLNEHSLGNKIWTRSGISYILTNERYCGDMRLQKKYTTHEFPYRLIRNRGDISQYYVYDVFPAVISRELYKKSVRKMEKVRIKFNPNQTSANTVYSFTGMIKCKQCGKNFKRKKIRQIPYWTCITHLENTSECRVKEISEDELQEAFISVYHRLKSNVFILESYMENIKTLSVCNEDIKELQRIDRHLELLFMEKEKIYQQSVDGLIDFVDFSERMKNICARRTLLETERAEKMEKSDSSRIIAETRFILDALKEKEMIEFDENIFHRITDSVEIDEKNICMNLKNDLRIQIRRKGRDRDVF